MGWIFKGTGDNVMSAALKGIADSHYKGREYNSYFDAYVNDLLVDARTTYTYGSLYDSEKYELKIKDTYLQKEIESLKASKKQYKDAIVKIEKKIEEYEKHIE